MKDHRRLQSFYPIILLIAFSLTACTNGQDGDSDQSEHSLDSISKIVFEIEGASIEAIGADQRDLSLTLVQPASGFNADRVTQTEEEKDGVLYITIKQKHRNGGLFWNRSRGYKRAELRLPPTIPLELRTSGGSIRAQTLAAPLSVDTAGGSIRLAGISSNVAAKTSGGSITLEESKGSANLKTSGGSISVSGEFDELTAKTSGGSIKADLFSQPQSPLELATSGGSVRAELRQGHAASVSLSTAGGSVTLRIPRDQAADLQARSGGGRVSLDHSGTFAGTTKKSNIEGRLNGGGPSVRLRTSGGSVRISEI